LMEAPISRRTQTHIMVEVPHTEPLSTLAAFESVQFC
jgi:hypothetical protein